MIYNPFFTIEDTTRIVKKNKIDTEVPAVTVAFKGVVLAIFLETDLRERAHAYIETYGYLAEWRRRYITKEGTSWDDSLFVQIKV